MPYMNFGLRALLALGISLLAVPGLRAQTPAQDAPTVIRGDVNGDGRVTREDAEAVRAYLVRGTVPGGRSILPAGDANGDGRVTAADAALISRYVAGVDVSRFPVGRPVGAGSEGGARNPAAGLMSVEYACILEVRTRTESCREVGLPEAGGARLDLTLGTGSRGVTFQSSWTHRRGNAANEDTSVNVLSFKNNIGQPIGAATDGSPHPNGNRLFITALRVYSVYPPANLAEASIRAELHDGTGTIVNAPGDTLTNRPYYQYDGILAQNATSAADSVKLIYSSSLQSLEYRIRVLAPVQFENGWINITPVAPPVIAAGGPTTTLTAAAFNEWGEAVNDVTWSSLTPGVATVNSSTGEVTGVAGGTATIVATSSTNPLRTASRLVHVIQAINDNVAVTGNVRVTSPDSLIHNDLRPVAVTLSFIPWGGTSDETWKKGEVDQLTAGGKFTYNPPAGFTGTDSVAYVITANSGSVVDTGKVALTVQDMIWFVGGPSACDPGAGNADDVCGRLLDPYPTLASFQVKNTGAGKPKAGDAIFVYDGSHTGSVTLLPQQKLIGQDAGATLASIAGITLAAGSDALPAMTPGGTPVSITGTVTLADINANTGVNNTVRGLSIAGSGGAALTGTEFGSPVIEEVNLSASGGPVLDLNTGTVNSTFAAATTSTGSSTFGLRLRSINGTLNFAGGGSILDADSAAFRVSGGNVDVTWPGTIDQRNNAPLVHVSAHESTGALTFSGSLIAKNGTGLQFNDADGTYEFTGTTTLTDSAAISTDSVGIDITNASEGTFTFGPNTTITNPSGAAFNLYGSTAAVTYSGSISKASAGNVVEIGEHSEGTVTFQTGILSATAGTGIQFSNAGGTYNFSGTTTLNGGDAGIDILSTSTGTFNFGASTLVQNPTGTAFNVNGSSPNVTFNGSLFRTANNALLVDLTSVALSGGKTILFDPAAGTDSLYATIGDGIQLSNVDGAVDFNGRVRLAGGNAGVDIISGSTGNIDFDAATIVNPTGEALRIFNGSGGDQAADVAFAGSITTNAGRPVLIEDVGSGAVAVSASINATAGQGILVQNNSGGTFTFSNTTQTLNTGANAAVTLANNTNATVNFTGANLDIDVTSGAGFTATGGGTVTVQGANNTVSATGGGTAVNVANTNIGAAGLNFLSVAANGGTSGIVLNTTGTSGALTVSGSGSAGSGGTIQNTTGAGISLTSTTSPSFGRMIVQNTGSHGIYGALVNHFSLTNSTVTNSGTSEVAGRQESNLSFYQNAGTGTERNVTGTVTITGNTLSNALHHGINITQYDGTITSLNVSNNTFTSATSSVGTTGATASKGTAVNVNLIGSGSTISSLTSSTISNNVITGFPGNAGILFSVGNANTGGPSGSYGTAADSITIQNNRIRGHNSGTLMNTQAVNIAVNGRGTGFFRVLDNGTLAEPITNVAGHVINLSAFGTAVLNVRVHNNRIVANNTVGSNGISMGVDSAAGFTTTTVMNAVVSSNNISATHGSGILGVASRSGTLNARYANNSIGAPATSTYGLQLRNAASTTNTATVCFDITGNTVAAGPGGTFPGTGLRRQSGAVTNGPNVFGITGLPSGSSPAVENYVGGKNTSASGSFGSAGVGLASATTGFTNCTLSF
jgi:hypothetical protein